MRDFEYDDKKSALHLKKHGIDFVAAQELWLDPELIDDLDLSTIKRPNQKQKRINVDFLAWVVDSLYRAASRIGVTRQSIIKLWLVERLEERVANK
ncbi:MAG: BrnT family toxin [Mariprofundus sp.]|nr:BrnT family toxin [Mariprofundus sp.]